MILDGKKEQIEAALQRFGQKSKGKEASLFYFTGHGQQWGGKNYLYPVDVVIQPQDKIHQTAIEIGDVLSQMSLSRIKILILDACRTRIAGQSCWNGKPE